MARIPIALQLYSVREDCARDLPGTIEAVAKMGYEGVEFAGYYDRSAEELRALLDDVGLKAVGAHTPLGALLGDQFAETVTFNRTLGNRFLIVPSLPEERSRSRQDWVRTAELFNEISQKLSREDMVTGYHNHWVEFEPMAGEMPFDLFFGKTRQEVTMQLDTGNALSAGADPVAYLERYPGRALTVHLKEHSRTNPDALIGEGDVRWDDVLRLCETSGGTQWYIVEQGGYPYPPLECAERCLQALRGMGR